jgi:hypothetical protein
VKCPFERAEHGKHQESFDRFVGHFTASKVQDAVN